MYNGRRVHRGQTEETVKHRMREDAAPRLAELAPQVATLRLILEEQRAGGAKLGLSYVRPIVVSSAPAYFGIRCMEPRCDGRHELTEAILEALRLRLHDFKAESACSGIVNNALCQRILVYTCEATYHA